jgi:acyl-CoA reductase-like NAD-dependent aldehyde dehydrogenase
VEESIKDQFVAKVVERTLKMKIGDNLDPETEISALVRGSGF